MQPPSYTFEALGTNWEVITGRALSDSVRKAIDERIEAFDKTYSRFRADSLVAAMAKSAGTYVFPDDIEELFRFYRQLYDVTSGKVTPLIGEVLERAGYDSAYSFVAKSQVRVPKWEEILKHEGAVVRTQQPVVLDVGAAGKGYLVDLIGLLLDEHKIDEYVIDASGDLIHKGALKNRVGLEHPFKPGVVIGVVDVQNRSLCASAVNRRTWSEGVHHIFDPDTQVPVKGIVATWVIAKKAMIADGLATALFFTDPAVLAQHFEYQYVRMYENGAVDYSHDFGGELF